MQPPSREPLTLYRSFNSLISFRVRKYDLNLQTSAAFHSCWTTDCTHRNKREEGKLRSVYFRRTAWKTRSKRSLCTECECCSFVKCLWSKESTASVCALIYFHVRAEKAAVVEMWGITGGTKKQKIALTCRFYYIKVIRSTDLCNEL